MCQLTFAYRFVLTVVERRGSIGVRALFVFRSYISPCFFTFVLTGGGIGAWQANIKAGMYGTTDPLDATELVNAVHGLGVSDFYTFSVFLRRILVNVVLLLLFFVEVRRGF